VGLAISGAAWDAVYWETQTDMALALVGAIIALLLSKFPDNQLVVERSPRSRISRTSMMNVGWTY
jgi:hypothetical protein